MEHIIQRLMEGLNAQVVKIAQFEGTITDEVAYVDFAERRAYAELIVKLGGYYVPTERIVTPQTEADTTELIERILGTRHDSKPSSEKGV